MLLSVKSLADYGDYLPTLDDYVLLQSLNSENS